MKLLLSLTGLILAAYTAAAQPGSLDAGFGTGGIVHTLFGAGNGSGHEIIVQPNGYILCAGTATIDQPQIVLARYKPDGSPDPSFGVNGKVIQPSMGYTDEGQTVALQTDGKIILGGYAYDTSTNYTSDNFTLIRYKPDGQVDSSFGINGLSVHDIGGATDRIYKIVVQPDGKIIATGESAQPSAPYNYSIIAARYLSDGSPDNSFGINGVIAGSIPNMNLLGRDITLQPDGKILLSGEYAPSGTYASFLVTRLNSDGSPDAAFGANGLIYTSVNISSASQALVLQPDGKIVLAGTSNDPQRGYLALVRYNSDGTPDGTFGVNGQAQSAPGTTSYGMDVQRQSDGKLLVCGYGLKAGGHDDGNDYLDFLVARFLPDGSVDSSFGTDGSVFTNIGSGAYANSLAIQPDGRILAFGNTGLSDGFAIARYNNDLSPQAVAPLNRHLMDAAVFPNPAQEAFSLRYSLNRAATVSIRLFTAGGVPAALFPPQAAMAVGAHTQRIPRSAALPAGAYYLQVQAGNEVQNLPLILQ